MKWTDKDDELLRAHYPKEGAKVTERFPKRSKSAVLMHCFVLGLKVEGRAPRKPRRPALPKAQPTPQAASSPATPPAAREAAARDIRYGPRGMPYVHGTTAGTTPGLQPVPDEATNLPWVSYPRDPATARACAAALDFLAHDSKPMQNVGPEAQRFFDAQARYLRVLADRMEKAEKAAA